MWKWISEEVEKGSALDVNELKHKWLEMRGYKHYPTAGCFFCQYDDEQRETRGVDCHFCPGKLVSRRFGCENETYNWFKKPTKFYKKLLELDKKRRSRGDKV